MAQASHWHHTGQANWRRHTKKWKLSQEECQGSAELPAVCLRASQEQSYITLGGNRPFPSSPLFLAFLTICLKLFGICWRGAQQNGVETSAKRSHCILVLHSNFHLFCTRIWGGSCELLARVNWFLSMAESWFGQWTPHTGDTRPGSRLEITLPGYQETRPLVRWKSLVFCSRSCMMFGGGGTKHRLNGKHEPQRNERVRTTQGQEANTGTRCCWGPATLPARCGGVQSTAPKWCVSALRTVHSSTCGTLKNRGWWQVWSNSTSQDSSIDSFVLPTPPERDRTKEDSSLLSTQLNSDQ